MHQLFLKQFIFPVCSLICVPSPTGAESCGTDSHGHWYQPLAFLWGSLPGRCSMTIWAPERDVGGECGGGRWSMVSLHGPESLTPKGTLASASSKLSSAKGQPETQAKGKPKWKKRERGAGVGGRREREREGAGRTKTHGKCSSHSIPTSLIA